MATTPDFKQFNRVQQADRHDDAFAVIAMLGGATLDNIRQQAEVFGLPQVGPYYPFIDGDLIAKLLTSRGLVGTVWQESKEFKDLPEVAIAMVDYDADWEVGRCVLYHRLPKDHPSKVTHYVIDPYPHADAKLHIRADLSGLRPAWHIGVHPMPAGKAKGK